MKVHIKNTTATQKHEKRYICKEDTDVVFPVQNIGLAIREARLKAHLTQTELANKTGMNRILISKIERNKSALPITTLIKIVEQGLNGKVDINIIL